MAKKEMVLANKGKETIIKILRKGKQTGWDTR